MITQFNFTKRIYQVCLISLLGIMLFMPYAFKGDEAITLGKLFILMPTILNIVFLQKFKGSLLGVANQVFITLHIVAHLLPITYYFMLRNAFFPNFAYFVLLIFLLSAMTAALYLDNDPKYGVFKYDIRKVSALSDDKQD